MPIEIRQLIIRATVTDEAGNQSKPATGAESSGGSRKRPDSQALVAECVEQVMEILREQQER